MKLTQNQIDFYKEKGYLIIENLFTESEIKILNIAGEKFNDLPSLPNVILEKNGSIRSIFAPHEISDSFEWLYRQKRLIEPVEQLIGEQIYLYQFKLNNKKGLSGEWWEWHQDFPYWHFDDGIKSPNMLSVMVLFQNTNTIQGPLIFIPGSHKLGIVDFEPKGHLQSQKNKKGAISLINSLNNDLKYTVRKELISKAMKKGDVIVGEGKIGTCILFHPNLFHASNSNLSPIDRNTAIITYNNIKNTPLSGKSDRPDYLCSKNFNAIKSEKQKLKI